MKNSTTKYGGTSPPTLWRIFLFGIKPFHPYFKEISKTCMSLYKTAIKAI
jgi:hypothetical protein